MKTCRDCKEVKPEEEFSWRIKNEGIRQTRCKLCFKVFLKNYHQVRKYGITSEDRQKMIDEQGGACFLCNLTSEELEECGYVSVLMTDHDHQTGTTRRILCNRCNIGLSLFDDDPERLEQAAAYIRSFR